MGRSWYNRMCYYCYEQYDNNSDDDDWTQCKMCKMEICCGRELCEVCKHKEIINNLKKELLKYKSQFRL